jgi:RNA polymerase sigma-70 factor (ECF subfamily)
MMGDDLIRQAQQGDRAAVEALFRREWKPIYRLVYRAVGDGAEAQDLTQEVFIRALTSLDRFEQTGTPFAGYLSVIARNLLRDRWRRRRLPMVPVSDAAQLASAAAGPEQAALIADEQTRLEALLAPLPPDYRKVIQLRVLEGRSTEEVAAIMQRSPGAIRILQHRAITTLRTQIQEGRRR